MCVLMQSDFLLSRLVSLRDANLMQSAGRHTKHARNLP